MHARQPARRAGVDAADGGVRVRTAHESRLQHFRELEIVDEAAAAPKERPVLEPQHAFADRVGLRHSDILYKILCVQEFLARGFERGPIGSGWNGPSRKSR